MLEFTAEQVKALCEIDEMGFVERVRADLVAKDPTLADDASLPSRLWSAYQAARALGIHEDENLVSFLRIEAYAPKFYEKPATHLWLTRPGSTPDQRFHDYLRVMRWQIAHPELVQGLNDVERSDTVIKVGDSRAWTRLYARWNRLIGRGGYSRDS